MFSTGGSYSLGRTIGQPDAGPLLSGDDYLLEGGFWCSRPGGVALYHVYLPLVVRTY